jgi:hypothetical protein
MEIALNIWLAFNIVFGCWSARNWVIWLYTVVRGLSFTQSMSGEMLDLSILTSVVAYYMTVIV